MFSISYEINNTRQEQGWFVTNHHDPILNKLSSHGANYTLVLVEYRATVDLIGTKIKIYQFESGLLFLCIT